MIVKHTRHILQILALAIVLLAGGPAAFAASTFTVSNPTGSTFRITRTGNTSVSETIDWRVVSLSAIAGTHFTGYNGNYSGTVTFNVNDTYKDVTISESTPGDNAYKYQNGTSRSYRFEVLDKNGDILASKDRSITTGTSVTSSAYNTKDVTVNSGTITVTDDNYVQAYHAVPVDTYFSNSAPKNYFVLAGAELHMTLSFQAKEKEDGYQHLQILVNQTSNHDEGSGDNKPGTMNYSSYMATFCHQGGSTNTTYASYSFPVTSVGDKTYDKNNLLYAWTSLSNNVGDLRNQQFNANRRAGDGTLLVSTNANLSSFSTLGFRFDASGDNEDTWYAYNTVAHIQAVDGTAPTVQNNYKVSGGRHQKGNTVYVSVPFSEIVKITGSTKKLTTSWGDLAYEAGDGTNVLTFKGEISSTASGTLIITGMSGTIKDLAENSFSNPWSSNNKDLGTALDSDYAWSTSNFNSLNDGSYEIYTTLDLRHLALMVNSGNNNCSGLTFKQTHDITYTHTTAWDNASSQEDNYTAIGTKSNTFQGTFDGQGHTVSGIRIYKGDNSVSVDSYQGLFGSIKDGIVRGVNLADARITGNLSVGGIVASILTGATVEDCTVAADVCIHAVQSDSDYHGGIVGYSQGTVRRCLSRASLTVANATGCKYYGAILGDNNTSGHTVKDCIAIGATVPNVENAGAIIGNNNQNSIQRNYYRACTVAGVENATGVGVGYDNNTNSPHDLTTNHGAQALYSLTLPDGVTLVRTASATLPGTGNATYTTGADIDGMPYAFDGATLSLSYSGDAAAEGYNIAIYVNGVLATDNGDGTFTATMPAADASVTTAQVPIPWSGSGDSANDPYLIEYPSQLDLLATNVNAGNSYSGKYFALKNGITYSHTTNWNSSSSTENNYTAIGTGSNKFRGTFDGRNFTISGIRIYKGGDTAATDDYLGLFGAIGSNGVVKGVNLADARITGHDYVGGIAGYSDNATVEDCNVAADVCIHAMQYGSYHGGIAGYSTGTVQRCISRSTLTISVVSDRSFYGAIVGQINPTDGKSMNNCLAVGATVANINYSGAIAGRSYASSQSLSNNYYRACTVAGAANATGVGIGPANISDSRHDVTTNQGALPLYSLTLPGDVTLVRSASATLPGTGNKTYTTGADIDGTPYAFEGATLTLSYTGDAPAQGDNIALYVNGVQATDNGNGTYTATMPAKNVTVTTQLMTPVSYIDADGNASQASCIAIVSKTMNQSYGETGKTNWYYVSGDVSTKELRFRDEVVNIILCDGATLSINVASGNKGLICENGSVNIFAQSGGSGKYIFSGGATGIGSHRNVTINGGTITVSNANYGLSASNGDVTIRGGIVNVSGIVYDGISAQKNVNITGGIVSIVSASSNDFGIHAVQTITLGCSSPADRITASSYECTTLKVADGQTLTDGTDTYTGSLSDDQKAAIAGKTLRMPFDPAESTVALTARIGTLAGQTHYWATFYNPSWNYTLPREATAFIMKDDKHLYRVGDGTIIPARVAVIIMAESASLTLSATNADAPAVVGNILHGSGSAVPVAGLSGTPYVLGKVGEVLGFYQYTGTDLPAGKAYYIVTP